MIYFVINNVTKLDILISNLVFMYTAKSSRSYILLGWFMFSADFARLFTTWETESQQSQGSLKSFELLLYTQLFWSDFSAFNPLKLVVKSAWRAVYELMTFIMCVWAHMWSCACEYATAHVWTSEDNLQKSLLFYYVFWESVSAGEA